MNDLLKMDVFFPSELLSITSVEHNDSSVHITMRSKTHFSKCPECGHGIATYHGTYLRKVQDLPILVKSAQLYISAHEYTCNNEACSKVTFVEEFDGFLSYYVSAKYSCGFPNPLSLYIIVDVRYLDYFTTITEDRLWQLLANPVFRWRSRSGSSMNVARAA